MTHPVLAVLCALGLLAMPSTAQTQMAGTVRISNDPVFLQVRVNGTSMRLKVFNGEMARISSGGTTVGVTPRIVAGGVDLHIYEILLAAADGAERMREVEQATLVRGVIVALNAIPVPLEVELLDALALPPLPAEWSSQPTIGCTAPVSQRDTPTAAPLGPCSECCVKCDGVTACACEVWHSCGHCCCSSGLCGPCVGLAGQ